MAQARITIDELDAVLHARWLANRQAISRVRRRIVDADVAFSEQLNSTHGPLSFAAEENRQLARELDFTREASAIAHVLVLRVQDFDRGAVAERRVPCAIYRAHVSGADLGPGLRLGTSNALHRPLTNSLRSASGRAPKWEMTSAAAI